MTNYYGGSTAVTLSWARLDPEAKWGLRSGRFTQVNAPFALFFAVLISAAFFGVLIPLRGTYLADMFWARGLIPFWIVLFTTWSLVMLWIKYQKLRLQRKALAVVITPTEGSFVLSPETVKDVTDRVYHSVDDPRKFFLFNRVMVALSNLKNLGRVSDVDDILRSQGQQDESSLETSYYLLQGFVWAIPVLGFIGTVLGLSDAIGGFGSVLAGSSDTGQLKEALKEVTGGLATAFETTLIGLVAALAVQLGIVSLKKAEEEFLDDCAEYCTRNIVGRLRLLPFSETRE